MATLKQAREFNIEENIIKFDVSYRGGSLKVNVSELFPALLNKRAREGYPDADLIMGAYQNYLGGGIAGAIVGAAMFDPAELSARDQKAFELLKERMKKFFHDANNGGGDEYMQENYGTYEQNQSLPTSAY